MSGIYVPNTDMPKSCGSCPYNESSCYCSKTKSEIDRDYEYVERLADCPLLEVAEEQGLLIRLPKTLYEAHGGPRTTYVIEWEVTGVRYYNGTVHAYTVRTTNVRSIIYGREIGKTVFLSREEAVKHADER